MTTLSRSERFDLSPALRLAPSRLRAAARAYRENLFTIVPRADFYARSFALRNESVALRAVYFLRLPLRGILASRFDASTDSVAVTYSSPAEAEKAFRAVSRSYVSRSGRTIYVSLRVLGEEESEPEPEAYRASVDGSLGDGPEADFSA